MTLLLAAGMAGCASMQSETDMRAEPGVSLRARAEGGSYIDELAMDVRGADFGRLKMCLAMAVSNSPVTLSGGTTPPLVLFQPPRMQTVAVPGGDIFKYEDPASATAIVIGSADGGASLVDTTRAVIRFELAASANADRSHLRFRNITRAHLDTGTLPNDGFAPVGAWHAAHPDAAIRALRGIAASIDACLRPAE
ncbi:MAG: hypothetical protein H5U26_11530 [Immundisolibacter sp.]|uniref:hypothetical protein n=1 Tax=Immundisolibacter sp. TaxID=1934948 RepID=UPI0019CB8D21|nr:hypothetical protein [Immundisolibacter sp.]MBC7162720.1 hypothetical protein [Immundisolibacter sp.]